jgi:hypothetical protein
MIPVLILAKIPGEGNKVDYVKGANIGGFVKVADAMLCAGCGITIWHIRCFFEMIDSLPGMKNLIY